MRNDQVEVMKKIDPRELRRALGTFITGVTVVTTLDKDGVATGFTANSFTSVSLDEPLVLFCLAASSSNREIYLASGKFAINILAENQQRISGVFASPQESDRFADVQWRKAATGSPILEGAAAWFDCVLHETVEAGDHIIVIGRVLAFDHNAANPLGYWRGNYVSAKLEHRASDIGEGSGQVGAIIECEDQILLLENPQNGELYLPQGSHIGVAAQRDSLLGVLSQHGVQAEIGFVFSVFESSVNGQLVSHKVYYRGTADPPGIRASAQVRWFGMEELPWSRLPQKEIRTMLHRYFDESQGGRYSIYVGDREQGKVHTLN